MGCSSAFTGRERSIETIISPSNIRRQSAGHAGKVLCCATKHGEARTERPPDEQRLKKSHSQAYESKTGSEAEAVSGLSAPRMGREYHVTRTSRGYLGTFSPHG